MGCDGIWQKYVDDNQGMVDLVRQDINKKDGQKLVGDLLDKLVAVDTMSGLGCDNMTAVLITFE